MKMYYSHLKFLVFLSLLVFLKPSEVGAQTWLEAYHISGYFNTLSTSLTEGISETNEEPSNIIYHSSDSGYSIRYGDTLTRTEHINADKTIVISGGRGIVFPDEYSRTISFKFNRDLQSIQHFEYSSHLLSDSLPFHYLEIISVDSIHLIKVDSGFYGKISGAELRLANFTYYNKNELHHLKGYKVRTVQKAVQPNNAFFDVFIKIQNLDLSK